MGRDPFADLQDAPLFIVPRVLDGLRAYRAALRADAPGAAALDGLVVTLLEGVEGHPTRFWVLRQCQKTLDAVEGGEAEAPRAVRAALGKLMEILGISSSDGVSGSESR